MNLSAQFKDYLFSQSNPPSKVTVKNYISDINKFIRWFEAKLGTEFSPSEVSQALINSFKEESLRNYSASSVERSLSSLRKFFYFLKLEGHISSSPLKLSSVKPEEQDPWMLKDFKSHLYVFNASHLTIKNYIIDIKQFLTWVDQVVKTDDSWEITKSNNFSKINSSLIEEYKNRLLKEAHLSPVSVNRKLSSIRRFVSWANEEGFMKEGTEVSNLQANDFGFSAAPKVTEIEPTNKNNSGLGAYSTFPPLRLAQKTKDGAIAAFDSTITVPVAEALEKSDELVWNMKGNPVFKDSLRKKLKIPSFKILDPKKINNVPKSFYAPALISTKDLPFHKKIWHHARNSRPKWYKRYHSYSFVSYLHFSILMLFISVMGYIIFSNLDPKQQPPTFAALPSAPPRILSFQGRLTDASDNPITKGTTLRMAIYNSRSASGSALLWQEIVSPTPDEEGIFSILLGNNTPIPQSLFAQNSGLWLGVTVERTSELTPRQQIATVAFASNAETLQGLPPITNSTATSNVVLALNSSGNLTIGGTASPTFQATGGTFTLSGKILVLSTSSNGDIRLTPNGTGSIDIQKSIKNTSNNGLQVPGAVTVEDLFSIVATSSGQAALSISQGSSGDLITASTSGVTKFKVDHIGNLTANGTYNGLAINSGTIISGIWNGTVVGATYGGTGQTSYTVGDILYASSTTALAKLNIGTSAQCLIGGTTPSWGTCSTGTSGAWWSQAGGALYPDNTTVDFLIGGQSTASAKFAVLNVNSGTPTASISANSGNNASYLTGTGNLATANSQTLTIGGTTTGNITLSPLNSASGAKVLPGADNTVSIGSSPSARFKDLFLGPSSLHVQCTTGDGCGQGLDYALGVNTSTGTFSVGVNGTSATGNPLLNITQGGDVGIGTTTPNTKLDVNGMIAANGSTTITGNPTSVGSNVGWKIGLYANSYAIGIAGWTQAFKTAGWLSNFSGNPSSDATATNPDSGATVSLNINGSANWTEATPGTTPGSIHIDPNNATDHFGGAITFGASDSSNGNNAQAGIYTRTDGTYGSKMYFATTDNYTTGAKTRMQIDSNGNVGIGATSPIAKLEVSHTADAAPTTGTMALSHPTSYQKSSLVFPSRVNYGSDYGFIQYQDSSNNSTGEDLVLTFGTSNDADDDILIDPSGRLRLAATNITLDTTGNLTTPGYVSITGASDGSGNLRFSAANPYIYASSYFIAPGGAYFNSGTVYTEAELKARGGISDDGGELVLNDTIQTGIISCIQGTCPANGAVRLTPNLHLNAGAGYAVYLNYDNGTTGTSTALNICNGASGCSTYFRADGYMFAPYWGDSNNGGYYVDPNGNSNVYAFYRYYGYNGPEYDGNNGGYYVDPNSTSNMYYISRERGFGAVEYDISNTAYFVNPDSQSVFERLDFSYGYDRNNGAYYIDLDNTTNMAYSLAQGWMQSPIWYDLNNNGYYIDGNNTSSLNVISAGSATIGTLTVPSNAYIEDTYSGYDSNYVCQRYDTNHIEFRSTACTTSSIRFKHDVNNLDYGLDEIMRLRPVSFIYNNNPTAGGDRTERRIGFIAEEMDNVIPEIVEKKNGEILGIDYPTLTALNTRGIQQQQLQIMDSKNRIASIEADLSFNNVGDLNLVPNIDGNFEVKRNTGEIFTRIGAFSDLVVANIKAGYFETGKLIVTGSASVKNLTTETLASTIGNFSQISTDSIVIGSENISIAGQSIREYITLIVEDVINNKQNNGDTIIVAPILEADIISPKTGKDIAVKLPELDSKFIIRDSSNSAVASIDASGNASFSGRVSSQELEVSSDASISGTLRAKRIIADEIDLSDEALAKLEGRFSSNSANITNNYYNSTPSATNNQQLATSDYGYATGSALFNNLTAMKATFNQGLMAFGSSSFYEASVADRLFIGSRLSLADTSINVLGGNLELQPLKQGGIAFVGGQVEIDVDGNLKVDGNAYFAKDIEIKGKLFASIVSPLPGRDFVLELGERDQNESENHNSEFIIRNSSASALLSINDKGDLNASGAGTFNKLNLNIVNKALAISPTEVIATGSAGTAEIQPNREELTVRNPLVNEDSLIYITTKTSTQSESVYLLRQVPGKSFTVGISNPINKKVPFNWIIIN